MQITDTQGNIKNTYDYDVWGNFLEKNETIDNPFTYFGQTYDEVTGLYYLRARYYDSTTGRFTGQDPAEDGYNWYVYGNNNPILYIDPTGENILNPWYRQQVIWMNGVRALKIGGLNISGEMLHHSIRWFDSDDVYIKDEWNGTTVNGTDRIDGNNLVYELRNNGIINNEIDWQKKCAISAGNNSFYWSGVLTLNNTTDMYLSFNNATVTINGNKNSDGNWITRVTVFDKYDFDIEKLSSIKSFKTAIGGAAGSVAALEQVPIIGAIKPYYITVEYLTSR